MRALFVASLLVFGVSAFAEDHGHGTAPGGDAATDTAAADGGHDMKKMSKKEASAACKKMDAKMKGKDLQKCIQEKTKG